jgi:hypothetical protein
MLAHVSKMFHDSMMDKAVTTANFTQKNVIPGILYEFGIVPGHAISPP